MKYKHIIWDWNGTIVNDAWLSFEILSDLLKKTGLRQITLEEYRDKFSYPVSKFYEELGFNASQADFEKLGKDFIVQFKAKERECKLNCGVEELIKRIHALQIPQSVLSAYQIDCLKDAAKFFGLDKYMREFVGLADIHANTKLQLGKKYIASLNLNPREILIIGDTDHDFEVAKTCGTDCFLMATGHQSKPRLQKISKNVFDDFESLKNALFEE